MSSEKPKVFTRDATGLVRSLGWWDSFGVGFGGVVLGVAMTSFYFAIPSTLPNANLIGSLLFLLIVLVPYLLFTLSWHSRCHVRAEITSTSVVCFILQLASCRVGLQLSS